MGLVTIAEYEARNEEIKARLEEIDTTHPGTRLPEETRSEWAELTAERKDNLATIEELEARTAFLETIEDDDTEPEKPQFQSARPGATRSGDIYDLTTVRASITSPEDAVVELKDRAMRSLDQAKFPDHVDQARAQAHVEKLLDDEFERDQESYGIGESRVASDLSKRMLITGSPLYRKAMTKYIAGRGMTAEEQRALSLGTGSAGGFSVVYTLDPTVVPTSNFSVNPFRAVARIETITGTNEWKAITAGAITAAYGAEAQETVDNAPTLAQPDIIVEKCQAFVPFSVELGQDWGALQTEMGSLLQDAKDDVEATKFALGAGHGSNEPKGIITGATATTTAGGVAAFAIADLYKLLEALPPRFRPRAQWMGNLFTLDKIRQFDTAGGSGVWLDSTTVPDTRGLGAQADAAGFGTVASSAIPRLIGRNVWESTAMASALTTGQKILVIGDWRYFVIVERVGMDIEVMPQLLGANRRPTGQRGLYAWWRNSADVLSTAAFQVLVTG